MSYIRDQYFKYPGNKLITVAAIISNLDMSVEEFENQIYYIGDSPYLIFDPYESLDNFIYKKIANKIFDDGKNKPYTIAGILRELFFIQHIKRFVRVNGHSKEYVFWKSNDYNCLVFISKSPDKGRVNLWAIIDKDVVLILTALPKGEIKWLDRESEEILGKIENCC